MNESERKYRRDLGVTEADTLEGIEHLIRSEGWSVRWAQGTPKGKQVWHICRVRNYHGVELAPEGDPSREIAALHALNYVRHMNPHA